MIRESIPLEAPPLPYHKEQQRSSHEYLPNLASIKRHTKPHSPTLSDKEVLTLDDLRRGPAGQKSSIKAVKASQKSYNQMVFLQLKKILEQASSTYYAKKHIVLNSYISTILSSRQSRERFKELLASDFGLDDETIGEQLKKNRTVWDWVIFLSP
jgi:hypothetical protein